MQCSQFAFVCMYVCPIVYIYIYIYTIGRRWIKGAAYGRIAYTPAVALQGICCSVRGVYFGN